MRRRVTIDSFQQLMQVLDLFTRYGGTIFYVGNLLLCIERAVAVLVVSSYEKCVSPAITTLIIVFAVG